MNIFILASCMAVVALCAAFAGYSVGISAAPVDVQPVAVTLQDEVSEPEPSPPVVLIPEPVEIIPPTVPSGSISIPGFEQLTVQGGTLRAGGITNPTRNNCYFAVTLLLADGKEFFRSGILAPGQSVGDVDLSEPLSPGRYESAVVRYSCYTLDTMQPLNGADISFLLEVLP